MFPNEEAAKIAVQTVLDYKRRTGSKIQVIFNVFKDLDEQLYRDLLEGKQSFRQ
jgi:O-acetyl-ADP-ribose deacetylase (regulator of RNase III)